MKTQNNKELLKNLGEAIYKSFKFQQIEHDYYFKGKLIPPQELFEFYTELDIARALSVYDFFQNKEFKILVIDDNIENFEEILKKIQETFQCFSFYKLNESKFNSIIRKICRGEENITKIKCIPICSNLRNNKILDMDLVLLDIYFADCEYSGQDVLKRLKWEIPGLPVFMLTKSHDIEEIKEAFKSEVEGYLMKERLPGLPWFIYQFYKNEIGDIVFLLEKKDRKKLVRSIIKWKRRKSFLWHGEKTQHLVEHAYPHSNMMWKFLNSLIDKINSLDKENLLALCLSIWLHDIGHKGWRKNCEPYIVRKKHALISGQLICEFPEIYLSEFKENTNLEKLKKKIALISAYHIRNSPIDRKTAEKLKEKIDEDFKSSSKEFDFLKNIYDEKQREKNLTEKIIYLEDLDNDLVLPAAILRILDVIDKGVHRTGMELEEDAKIGTTFEDIGFYLKELLEEKNEFKEKLGGNKYINPYGNILKELDSFCDQLNMFVRSYKERLKKLTENLRNSQQFKDAEKDYIEVYNSLRNIILEKNKIVEKLKATFSDDAIKKIILLIDQIFHLLDTPLHFYTHRSIENPEIKFDGDEIMIIYKFNKDMVNTEIKNFSDFNRVFQESWKIYSDIFRDFWPIEHIFREKNINFKEVKFIVNNEFSITFPLKENFVENELKFMFKTEKEMDDFVNVLNEILRKIDQQDLTVQDTFYDYVISGEWFLKKRGWSLRKRGEKFEVKIEPLYWKGEFEHRIELSENSSSENNAFEAFYNILANSKKVKFEGLKKEMLKINNAEIKEVISYEQKRTKWEVKNEEGNIIFEISADTVKNIKINNKNINDNLYIVEIEAKNEEFYKQEKDLKELKEKLKEKIPYLDRYICYKDKLSLILEK